jgi:glyoxylase-like metal-dependent hydrolase (beta-lactamase superfamily II)
MSSFRIWPLRTGTIIVDKGQYITRGIDVGLEVPIPATAWYLTDGRHKVLVDTGMCATPLADWHHPGSSQAEGEPVHERLKSLGVSPGEIELIVFTHLHWDHCHNVDQFPSARLVVSEAEVQFARDPLPIYYKSYEHERLGKQPPFLGCRFDTVNGAAEVLPGIEVFPTPGHSPGHQSVAVSTRAGTHVITGDACFSYVNLQPASDVVPFTILGRAMDLLAAWRSLETIVARADVVLPAHDEAVFAHAVYPV